MLPQKPKNKQRFIQLSIRLLLVMGVVTNTTYAQSDQPHPLNIGDLAPSLAVKAWIKGAPVHQFEKGKCYVLEFWATWCSPCTAAMPQLSVLARKYRDVVTFIGVDIYETRNTTMHQIKAFVDSMGAQMDFPVAIEDSNQMVASWLEASGEKENGIPRTFVVNASGRIAWMGYPKKLDEVLPKIINNTWDTEGALAKRNENKRLTVLEDSIRYQLGKYNGDINTPRDLGKPDSALMLINKVVKAEPGLQFMPVIASFTFSSLLKTDPQKAYEYGKALLARKTDDVFYGAIINNFKWYSNRLNLPAALYRLAAEAYQSEIDHFPYPEILDTHKYYSKMAEWYQWAGDKSKAIDTQQKAIKALENKKDFSKKELAEYQLRLQQYQKM